MKLQRLGGYAAIASVCVYLLFVAVLSLETTSFGDLSDPTKVMAGMSSAPVLPYVSDLLLLVDFILWFIVILALNERMQANAPNLTRIAMIAAAVGTAAGIATAIAQAQAIVAIAPTKDISAYRAFNAMTTSLFAFSSHAYGWVCLLIGFAVLKTRAFSKAPGWLFILTGIFWVRIPIPIIHGVAANAIPWLLYLAGSVWFGVALLRQKQPQPAAKEMAAAR